MAFDEALLEAAVKRGETVLRVYRWAEPTLSLGYFQKTVPADLPEAFQRLPCVRRLSGGGAILHDREWTYSCCLPKGHTLAQKAEALYDAVHLALIRAFASRGVTARMRGTTEPAAETAFLCFHRGDARDVLVAGRKVVGSAQRRRRGAVLQHGSVLLRASYLAPDAPGLLDLAQEPSDDPLFAAAEFVREIAPALFASEPIRESAAVDLAAAAGRVPAYEVPR
jgi:lipoate-protein ligase A